MSLQPCGCWIDADGIPRCRCAAHRADDVVCEHGRALDVHCCNCHSGFLFDASSCVCITEANHGKTSEVPWNDGPIVCTNCGEIAKPNPAYADFVGPFCDGCWAKLREHFGIEEDAWIRIAAKNAEDARDRLKCVVVERDEARREISLICGILSDMQAAWKQQFIVLNAKAVDFDRGYGTGLIQAVTEVSGLLKSVCR